jgi:plasmid stability protein
MQNPTPVVDDSLPDTLRAPEAATSGHAATSVEDELRAIEELRAQIAQQQLELEQLAEAASHSDVQVDRSMMEIFERILEESPSHGGETNRAFVGLMC